MLYGLNIEHTIIYFFPVMKSNFLLYGFLDIPYHCLKGDSKEICKSQTSTKYRSLAAPNDAETKSTETGKIARQR